MQDQQPLEVEWKLFSLGLNNNNDSDALLAPLRALILARREGDNETVNRGYEALGNGTHKDGLKPWEGGFMETALPQALTEAGLSPDLYAAAQADPSTLDDVKAEHQEAVDKFKAYGVPWLVPTPPGFRL